MRIHDPDAHGRIMASVEIQYRRHPANIPPDPGVIEAALRREARDVYGWANAPGDTYGEHDHSYTKLLYCTRGSIDFVVGGKRVALGPGDRLVLPPGTRHSAVVGPEGCACVEGKLPA
jgi:mannose-6-phosphate isomerase-like protein (cupin superfamily)